MKQINSSIVEHLKVLKELLDKVRQYFLAKIKPVSIKQGFGEKKEEKKFVQPLFVDMNHPRQDQVGLLMPLKCGHNGRPSDRESIHLEMHLEAAGFFKEVREKGFSSMSSFDHPELSEQMSIPRPLVDETPSDY